MLIVIALGYLLWYHNDPGVVKLRALEKRAAGLNAFNHPSDHPSNTVEQSHVNNVALYFTQNYLILAVAPSGFEICFLYLSLDAH